MDNEQSIKNGLIKNSISTKKRIFGENRCFFSNHLNLSTKSRIPLNRGALNPGLSVYIYIYIYIEFSVLVIKKEG